MKKHFVRLTALSIVLLPGFALAADPYESYDSFILTGRINEEHLAACREEGNIQKDIVPVGAQLFKLRRCINLKKAISNEPRRRTFLYRNQEKYKRVSERLETLRNETTSRTTRILSDRYRTSQQDDRRTRTEKIRELLRRQRTERRVSLRQREAQESQQFSTRSEAIRAYRTECAGLPGAERRDCIYKQLHNLNLTTDRQR